MKYNPWTISKQLMWPQVLKLPQNEQKRARTVDNGSTPGWPFQLHLNCLFRPFPLNVCVWRVEKGRRGRGLVFSWRVSTPHKWTAKMLTKTQAECSGPVPYLSLGIFSLRNLFSSHACVCVRESVAANSVSHLILWLINTQNKRTHTHT